MEGGGWMTERLQAIVGAKITEFRKKMAQVKAIAKTVPNKITTEVVAKNNKILRFFKSVKKHVSEIDGAFQDAKGRWRDAAGKFIKVDEKGFVIPVDADLAPFERAMKTANKRIKKFQDRMGQLANTIRTFGTVFQNAFGGGLVMIAPGAVPVLASAVGLLGSLGPMLATVGGSAFALATAFGFAGTAAVAFGAVAIPTIADLFDETKKLTKAQKKAKGEYKKFQKTWKGIVKDLEKPVLEAFSKSMQIANKTVKMARPLFDSAADAVNNLLNSLNQSLDSTPVKAFFDYMNKSAGPMLETLGKAFGNFMQGFMSMMVAFGPLAEETAQGFLNMSKGFAEWAAGLSESEKFQSFVKYIQENMPKIKSIFGDAIVGIVNTFAAFGPLASDMMTGLQDMMKRFKEWSETLGKNQQFQEFIGYIRDNAPKVIDLIGNLTEFIINLGIGFAPLGEKILDFVNNIIAWTNSMMDAHPIIGKIISVIVLLVGAFIAATPMILAFGNLFPGLGTKIIGAIGKILKFIGPALSKIGGFIIRLGTRFLATAGRIALSALIAMGPWGWVAAAVIALVALIVANWDKVKEWTIKTWSAISDFIANFCQNLMKWFVDLVLNLMEKWRALQTGTSSIMQSIGNTIQNIWNGIKTFFTGILTTLVSSATQKFSEIVTSISAKMDEALQTVTNIGNGILDFLGSIDLYDIGINMIQGLINGITYMAGSLVDAAKGVVDDAIEGAKNLLGIHSPSRVFMQIGKYTGEGLVIGMNKMSGLVSRASQSMAKAAMIEPLNTQLAFDTGLTSSDFGRIRHDIGADLSSYEMPQPIIIVKNEWDGEQVRTYVERGNARNSRITDGFGGK